jgi:hypothetical protein
LGNSLVLLGRTWPNSLRSPKNVSGMHRILRVFERTGRLQDVAKACAGFRI